MSTCGVNVALPSGIPNAVTSAMTVSCPTLTCNLEQLDTLPEKKRIFSAEAMAQLNVGTVSGAAARPRSMRPGSSWVTQTPTRSPCRVDNGELASEGRTASGRSEVE